MLKAKSSKEKALSMSEGGLSPGICGTAVIIVASITSLHPAYSLHLNKVNVTYSLLAYNNSVLIVLTNRYSLDSLIEGSCTQFVQNRGNEIRIYVFILMVLDNYNCSIIVCWFYISTVFAMSCILLLFYLVIRFYR